MDLVDSFAKTLKTLRIDADLSQETLALRSGLDRSFISLLERGQRQPTLTTLFILARVLKIPPHQLVLAVEKSVRRTRWIRQGDGNE